MEQPSSRYCYAICSANACFLIDNRHISFISIILITLIEYKLKYKLIALGGANLQSFLSIVDNLPIVYLPMTGGGGGSVSPSSMRDCIIAPDIALSRANLPSAHHMMPVFEANAIATHLITKNGSLYCLARH